MKYTCPGPAAHLAAARQRRADILALITDLQASKQLFEPDAYARLTAMSRGALNKAEAEIRELEQRLPE